MPGPEALARLLVALIADQLGRSRGRAVPPGEWTRWGPGLALDEDGLGVDSLTRLDLVARVNGFFHLAETGIEDYLLVRTTLGDWVELVGESLARWHDSLSFESSGSTGTPTRHAHPVARLMAEVEGHLSLMPPPARVVALVPPHHIYGYLFTVLLPRIAGCPVLDARARAPGSLPGLTRPGDLVIATPFLWDHVAGGGLRLGPGVSGVTSGAPAPAPLWPALTALGLDALREIYGSSETAGIGWRDRPDTGFTLLPHLERSEDGQIRPRRPDAAPDPCGPDGMPCARETDDLPRPRGGGRGGEAEPLALPDHLDWAADGRFRPAGRRDGAVQVGGVNVWPARVRDQLMLHPGVAAAAVRLDPARGRLKAFVVPVPGAGLSGPAADAAAELAGFVTATLTGPERPVSFAFGAALPVSAIGKPCDWPDPAPQAAGDGLTA